MAPEKKVPLIFTKECGYVPAVLVNAGEIIEKHINTENLFQVQGSTAKLKKLMSILSLQKMPKLRKFHVHDVVEVIKVCLSRLSNELIPEQVMTLLIEANQSQMTDFTTILSLYRKTAPLTFSAVHFTMRLLNKVIQHSESNGMNARKLATIFVLDVLKPLTSPKNDDQRECDYEVGRHNRLEKLPYLIMVVEQLILKSSSFKKASVYRPEVKLRSASIGENFDKKGAEAVIGDAVSKGTPDEAEGATSLKDHSPKQEPIACKERRIYEYKKVDNENFPNRSVSQTGRLTRKRRYSKSGKQPAEAIKSFSTQMNQHLYSSRKSASDLSMTHLQTRTVHFNATRGTSVSVSRSKAKKMTSLINSKPTVAGRKETLSQGPIKNESKGNKSLNRAIPNPLIRGGRCKKPFKDSFLKKTIALPFHQDEELLPWSNSQLDNDDTSIMQRSIRYPRVEKNRFFQPSEKSRGSSDDEDNSRKCDPPQKLNTSLPEAFAQYGGKSKASRDQIMGQTSSVVFAMPSINANKIDVALYRRASPSERSSLFSLSSPIRRWSCYSRNSTSCSSSSQISDTESESARCSPVIVCNVKKTLTNHRPTQAEQQLKVQKLKSLRVSEKPSRCLQRAADVIRLGLALFCTYLLFLLLQWYQGD